MNPPCGSLEYWLSILRQAECRQRRLVNGRSHGQTVVGLERGDRLARHRSKNAVNWSVVITVASQLHLHIHHDAIRRQTVIAVDRTVVRIVGGGSVTPGRIPPATVPIIPAVVNENDPVVMVSPPVAIVEFASMHTPRFRETISHVAVTIERHIPFTIDVDVVLTIDRHVALAVNVEVS